MKVKSNLNTISGSNKIEQFKKPVSQQKEKKKLIDKLDRLFSTCIRTRDGFRCQHENCTAGGNRMHCAHIFSRSRMTTRWDLDNAITLCYYHHIVWCHRTPVEFTLWIMKKIGEIKFKELESKSRNINIQVDLLEMKKIEKYLTNKLEEFEQKNADIFTI